jgi:putative DNA primase/helicase
MTGMMTSEICAQLGATQRNGAWWAKCPAHKDKNPSLKIDEGENGATLATCFAGCTFDAICEASGIPKSEWFGDQPQQRKSRIVSEYDYTDADGKLVFQVVRFEPKDFRQRRKDGDKWVWNLKGVDRPLYRLPNVLKTIAANKAVFVVEGEKDADALAGIGVTATCNAGGAGKWLDSYTETLSGAAVVIVPDKDAPGRNHAGLLKKRLEGKAKSVTVVELPDGPGAAVKDAADWIAAGGTIEDLREIVKRAPAWEHSHETEIADKRAATSAENGKQGGRPSAPPSSEVAATFAKQFFTKEGFFTLRHHRDKWFMFDRGWTEQSDGEIEKTVVSKLQDDEELRQYASRTYCRNIMANLASFNLCGIPAAVDMPCWLSTGEDARNWVAFANGVAVDVWSYAEQLANGKTPENYSRPVTPDLFSADFVTYDWRPQDTPTRWLDYLERVQPEVDGFDAVRRMMGLLLADTGRYEVFFQLYGQGANGKTVFLDVLQCLLGRQAVCRVPLEALSPGTRFQNFPLADCKANICGELSTDTGRGQLHAIEGNFKHCVSGGDIEIERKGIDKTVARCRARFVLSSNSLPTFVDKSNAIWRRLRIVPFPVNLPEDEWDVNLAEKICKSELPGVCAWALDGLAEIVRDGRITETAAGEKIKNQHRESCDHERTFLLENYTSENTSEKVSAKDLYEHYKEWISANGYRALGNSRFKSRVEAVFPDAEYGSIRINGITTKGYKGIMRTSIDEV